MAEDYSGDYWRMSALIDDVVESACLAVLRINGYYVGADGTFRSQGMPDDYPGVSAPGSGQYPDEPLPHYVGPEGFPQEMPSIGDIYRMMEEQIPPLFEPLLGLPHPGIFEAKADEVKFALTKLASDGNRGSGDESSGGTQAPSSIDYEGNSTLALAADIAQTLKTWQGGAAQAFSTYLNLFTVVVANQALAAEVLRITLYEEAEMFRRLRSDAVELADKAADAFGGCGGITVGDVKAAMSVVGTVNTVLGWFPAFAPVTGATGTALSVTGLLVDTFGGQAAEPNDLGARAPYDVIANIRGAVTKLQERSRTVEGDVEQTLTNLRGHLATAAPARTDGSADQESFRLARPSETYAAQGTADFITPGVVVNKDNIWDAADYLEKDIGYEMQEAWTALDEASGYQGWGRDPSIGIGTYGASSDYYLASVRLEGEIRETAKEMAWAAEMLRAVWEDVNGTDYDIGADFGRVRGKVERFDAPPALPSYPPGTPYPPRPWASTG